MCLKQREREVEHRGPLRDRKLFDFEIADADPDAPEVMAEFAPIWRDKPKYLYSRTAQHADWNTTIVGEIVPADIERLKAEPGGDMVVGGAELGQAFMALGLIDEYRVYVHPVVIGRGKPMFGTTPVSLRLEEHRVFGNGVVLLRYTPA